MTPTTFSSPYQSDAINIIDEFFGEVRDTILGVSFEDSVARRYWDFIRTDVMKAAEEDHRRFRRMKVQTEDEFNKVKRAVEYGERLLRATAVGGEEELMMADRIPRASKAVVRWCEVAGVIDAQEEN